MILSATAVSVIMLVLRAVFVMFAIIGAAFVALVLVAKKTFTYTSNPGGKRWHSRDIAPPLTDEEKAASRAAIRASEPQEKHG
jgi:hypothetical protein